MTEEKCPLIGKINLPQIGLGLWKIERDQAAEVVYQAIEQGYRHFDCASDYGNEKEVGAGLAKAMQDGLCSRDDLWITSKLWNSNHRKENVPKAIKRTLSDLQLDYLDLYLVHFPISLRHVPLEERYPAGWYFDPEAEDPKMELDPVPLMETWRAMEDLFDLRQARNIGVCNFTAALLSDLISYAKVLPAVLQVESHPFLVQENLKRWCDVHQIVFTAFSPLGAGSYVPLGMATNKESVLELPEILDLASKYHRSPAQIVLRWATQRGISVIPKTSRIRRLQENLSLYDFELTESECEQISAMDCGRRYNDPGVFCEKAFGTFCPIFD